MAKKTELKERGTNEVLYPVTLLECVRNGEGENITKADVGLGNVDNTADINKPVSKYVQSELDGKVNKVTGKGLSTNDFTNELKTKLDNLGYSYRIMDDDDLYKYREEDGGGIDGELIFQTTDSFFTYFSNHAGWTNIVDTAMVPNLLSRAMGTNLIFDWNTKKINAVVPDISSFKVKDVSSSGGLSLDTNGNLSVKIGTNSELSVGLDVTKISSNSNPISIEVTTDSNGVKVIPVTHVFTEGNPKATNGNLVTESGLYSYGQNLKNDILSNVPESVITAVDTKNTALKVSSDGTLTITDVPGSPLNTDLVYEGSSKYADAIVPLMSEFTKEANIITNLYLFDGRSRSPHDDNFNLVTEGGLARSLSSAMSDIKVKDVDNATLIVNDSGVASVAYSSTVSEYEINETSTINEPIKSYIYQTSSDNNKLCVKNKLWLFQGSSPTSTSQSLVTEKGLYNTINGLDYLSSDDISSIVDGKTLIKTSEGRVRVRPIESYYEMHNSMYTSIPLITQLYAVDGLRLDTHVWVYTGENSSGEFAFPLVNSTSLVTEGGLYKFYYTIILDILNKKANKNDVDSTNNTISLLLDQINNMQDTIKDLAERLAALEAKLL